MAVTVVLALGAGLAARAIGSGPWLVYAVVITSSSAAIALPVIEDLQLEGEAVLTAMAWITIADVLATVAIPLALIPAHAGQAAVGALIVAAVTLALLFIGRALRGTGWAQRVRHEGKQRMWAIDLRIAVTTFICLGWLAQRVGASLLVAGFGTGLVVAALGGPKRLSREVLGLGEGFFIPVFFVLLGAQLNLRALGQGTSAIRLAVALLALTIAVHVLTALVLRLPRAAGLLATAQVGVPAAVIALGLPLHAITQAQASAIFAAALATIAVSTLGGAVLRRHAVAAARQPAPAGAGLDGAAVGRRLPRPPRADGARRNPDRAPRPRLGGMFVRSSLMAEEDRTNIGLNAGPRPAASPAVAAGRPGRGPGRPTPARRRRWRTCPARPVSPCPRASRSRRGTGGWPRRCARTSGSSARP